jgi:hypothetical protein
MNNPDHNPNYDPMADLPESIPFQPIDPNPDPEFGKKALDLVRKVFADLNKPNAVLFKLDDGSLCVVKRENNQFNWEKMLHLTMTEELVKQYEDLSASNPFEFVFVYWDEEKFSTCEQKSIVPDKSFLQLADENKLVGTIELDYKEQYETEDTI